jgi:hypothetical protein
MSAEIKKKLFWIKNCYLRVFILKGRQATGEAFSPQKRKHPSLQKMKFINPDPNPQHWIFQLNVSQQARSYIKYKKAKAFPFEGCTQRTGLWHILSIIKRAKCN